MNKHARILVVDDDETIRKTMKAILEDEGYLVDLASTGKEAIQKSHEKIFDIALLDIGSARYGRHRTTGKNEG